MKKNITFASKVERTIRYNFSCLISLLFCPEKFYLLKWYEIILIVIFFTVTITMLVLSNQ